MIKSKKITRSRTWKFSLLLVFSLHLFLLINLKFTAWPEMLAWPYLMLKGWLPYRDIAIAHTPVLLFDLAIFNKIFGIGLVQLKLYTWILILMTDALIFYVAKKLWDTKIAIISLLFYLPLQVFYEGNGLWFDLALAPLALLIYYNLKRSNYLLSGIFFGLAFFTKQTAFWFIFPLIFYFMDDLKKREFRRMTPYVEGFLVVAALAFGVMAIVGVLPYFYQWAVKFGIFYLPRAEGQVSFPAVKQLLVSFFPFVILTPLIFREKRKYRHLVVWAFFALMGIYPRFELFHFQPALPFLAIGAAVSTMLIFKKRIKLLRLIFTVYVIIVLIFVTRSLIRNWGGEARFYGQNEINVASYVRASVDPGEGIYVLNYWDSIYAMTGTIPVTRPLVPFLPWYLEYPDLKDGVVDDLRLSMPKVMVVGEYTREGLGSYSVGELDELLQRYYKIIFMKGGVQIYKLNE
jgi:4-amino-4-deoxy-L-arabinose transferase-like glycosyltransferase